MKRLFAFLFVLALTAGVAFAGAGAEATAAPKILVYGTTEKVTDLDPAHAYDFHTWEIFYNIYQGLWAYEPGTTNLVPGLAESYTANSAGDEYTFKLRKGLKFTDGTPFTADAVKWSIDRVIALEGDPSWLVTDFVKAVEVVDDYSVKFILNAAYAFFPNLVATVPYYPVNPNVYPEDRIIRDPSELAGGQLVGLGPYRVVSFKRDEEVILEANESFWGDAPNIGTIVIRYFADATTMRLALEKGEIDLAYKSLNPSDIQDLSTSTLVNMFKLDGPQIRYICFETSELIFKDKRLRQAVAALIDRQELIDKVYLGQNSPLYSMVPNGMVYHIDSFKDEYGAGPDVDRANELLASAGYTSANPLEVEFWYTPSHYGDPEVNMAEVIKAQLEESPAMKVTIKSAEWATYKDQWRAKQMPIWLLGWYPDYIDPDNYTAAFAGTAGSRGMGINFSDAKWDGLFDTEQTSTDPAVRKAAFEELQEMWTMELPTLPLWQGDLYVFTNQVVTDVKIGPTLIFNYNVLRFTD